MFGYDLKINIARLSQENLAFGFLNAAFMVLSTQFGARHVWVTLGLREIYQRSYSFGSQSSIQKPNVL